MNEVLTAISTVGFPIVACGGLFWYIVKNDERHREEISKLSEAVTNNTLVMTRILDSLGGGDNVE